MNFILVAIGGYFLLSLEAVASKFLLTGKIKSWQTYVFYVGIFSAFSFFLLPFGYEKVSLFLFFQLIFSGILLGLTLVFLFRALIKSAASRVYVLFGIVATLTTLILNFIEGKNFFLTEFFGILVLMIGGFFISFKFYKGRFFSDYKKIILAGILSGCSLVILKQGFDQTTFVNGYVFSRIGMVLVALFLILIPSFRRAIKEGNKKKKNRVKVFDFLAVLGTKTMAGMGSILISYAIFLGSVTVVNALVSVQYLFTFFLATILAFYFKKEMQEKIFAKNLLYKALGIALVIFGVVLLSV